MQQQQQPPAHSREVLVVSSEDSESDNDNNNISTLIPVYSNPNKTIIIDATNNNSVMNKSAGDHDHDRDHFSMADFPAVATSSVSAPAPVQHRLNVSNNDTTMYMDPSEDEEGFIARDVELRSHNIVAACDAATLKKAYCELSLSLQEFGVHTTLVYEEHSVVPPCVGRGTGTIMICDTTPDVCSSTGVIDSAALIRLSRKTWFVSIFIFVGIVALVIETASPENLEMHSIGAWLAIISFTALSCGHARLKLSMIAKDFDFWYLVGNLMIYHTFLAYVRITALDPPPMTTLNYLVSGYLQNISGCIYAFAADASAYTHKVRSRLLLGCLISSVSLMLSIEPHVVRVLSPNLEETLLEPVDLWLARTSPQAIMLSCMVGTAFFLLRNTVLAWWRGRQYATLSHHVGHMPLPPSCNNLPSTFCTAFMCIIIEHEAEDVVPSSPLTVNSGDGDGNVVIAVLPATPDASTKSLKHPLSLIAAEHVEEMCSAVNAKFESSTSTAHHIHERDAPTAAILVPDQAPQIHNCEPSIALSENALSAALASGACLGVLGSVLQCLAFFAVPHKAAGVLGAAFLLQSIGYGMIAVTYNRSRVSLVFRNLHAVYLTARLMGYCGLSAYVVGDANGAVPGGFTALLVLLALIAAVLQGIVVFAIDASTFSSATRRNVAALHVVQSIWFGVSSISGFVTSVFAPEYQTSYDTVIDMVIFVTTPQSLCVSSALSLTVLGLKMLERLWATKGVVGQQCAMYRGGVHSVHLRLQGYDPSLQTETASIMSHTQLRGRSRMSVFQSSMALSTSRGSALGRSSVLRAASSTGAGEALEASSGSILRRGGDKDASDGDMPLRFLPTLPPPPSSTAAAPNNIDNNNVITINNDHIDDDGGDVASDADTHELGEEELQREQMRTSRNNFIVDL
eukprot:PhM_4_TR17798/c1_g1_i1/m.46652